MTRHTRARHALTPTRRARIVTNLTVTLSGIAAGVLAVVLGSIIARHL